MSDSFARHRWAFLGVAPAALAVTGFAPHPSSACCANLSGQCESRVMAIARDLPQKVPAAFAEAVIDGDLV
jgi:hypothetical protein